MMFNRQSLPCIRQLPAAVRIGGSVVLVAIDEDIAVAVGSTYVFVTNCMLQINARIGMSNRISSNCFTLPHPKVLSTHQNCPRPGVSHRLKKRGVLANRYAHVGCAVPDRSQHPTA